MGSVANWEVSVPPTNIHSAIQTQQYCRLHLATVLFICHETLKTHTRVIFPTFFIEGYFLSMGHTAGDEARTLCYVPLLGFFSKQSFGEFVQAG